MGIAKDFLKFIPNGVCNIVCSPDGCVESIDHVVCAVSACEYIYFFNMRTGEKIFQLVKEGHKVTTFKANPDKSLIAVAYANGEINVHKRTKQEQPIVFNGHKIGVNCLTFSEDSFLLASGGKESVIVVWDIVNEIGLFKLNGHKGSITQLIFTKDNKHLISSSKDFQIKFWNIASQSCFYTIAENVSEVYTFALLNSDRLLVVGSAEVELLVFELSWLDRLNDEDDRSGANDDAPLQTKKIWRPNEINALTGAEHLEEENLQANTFVRCRRRGALLRQAKGYARQIAVSSDNAILSCAGSDSLVDIYRLFTPEESRKRFEKKVKREKRKHENEEGSERLFESDIAKDITILIARVGAYQASAKVKWMDFCKGFKKTDDDARAYRMYCLLGNNSVHGVFLKLLKSNEIIGEALATLDQRGHRSDVTSLAFASNDVTFLSAAAESAMLWDFNTLTVKSVFTDEAMRQITCSLFTPQDREIVLCTKDGNMFLFDLTDCELIEQNKRVHDGPISAIVAFPKQDGFLTCGSDKMAKFWMYHSVQDFDKKRITVKQSAVLELPEQILCATISLNGKYMAFGLLDNTARVYYMDSCKFFVTLYGHSLPIFCMDISSDSKLIVTGSSDKTVKIWGLDFGDCHRSIFAHDGDVTCVKFGKSIDVEEQLFWSAGKDGKLKQWDALKFNKVQTLDGHTGEIRAMCGSSDGRLLITASHDKSIRLWELSDEFINLQEEEEKEREKDYEERLLDAEDIVPGEALEKEADFAPIKTIESVKSTEQILECIDILRDELLERDPNEQRTPHVLVSNYKSEQLHFFLVDALQKVQSNHLERSLLMVPLSYVSDILTNLCKCVKENHKVELCCRVILFLLKIHHNQIINSLELIPVVDEIRRTLPQRVSTNLDIVGFNLAALRFFQLNIEERKSIKLFRDVSAVEREKKKNKRKGRKRVQQAAVIKI